MIVFVLKPRFVLTSVGKWLQVVHLGHSNEGSVWESSAGCGFRAGEDKTLSLEDFEKEMDF